MEDYHGIPSCILKHLLDIHRISNYRIFKYISNYIGYIFKTQCWLKKETKQIFLYPLHKLKRQIYMKQKNTFILYRRIGVEMMHEDQKK